MTAPGPVGRVLRDARGVRLELVRELTDPPEAVWAALTEPALLERWFGTWSGDPATGTVQLSMLEDPDGAPQPVRIDACTAPQRLGVVLPSPDGPWPLDVALTPHGGGTRLVLVHVLAEPYDAGSIGPGWQYYLDRLTAVLYGDPVPDDWEAYAGQSAAYAVPPEDA